MQGGSNYGAASISIFTVSSFASILKGNIPAVVVLENESNTEVDKSWCEGNMVEG